MVSRGRIGEDCMDAHALGKISGHAVFHTCCWFFLEYLQHSSSLNMTYEMMQHHDYSDPYFSLCLNLAFAHFHVPVHVLVDVEVKVSFPAHKPAPEHVFVLGPIQWNERYHLSADTLDNWNGWRLKAKGAEKALSGWSVPQYFRARHFRN